MFVRNLARSKRLLMSATLLTLLASLFFTLGTKSSFANATQNLGHGVGALQKGNLPAQHGKSSPQHQVVNRPRLTGISTSPSTDPIDLKVLVIASDGSEADLPAIKQSLDYIGIPYTVYVAANTPGGLTPDKLYSGVHGYYNGVILTTGDLGYYNSTAAQWMSALSQTEWQNLWTYEATFGIRQASWYTYPTADFGFQTPSGVSTVPPNPAVMAQYTSAGAQVFGSYANTSSQVPIQYAYTYLAQPLLDGNTSVLLQDASGDALGAVRTYPTQGNRQNLALTFDSNPSLLHDLVFSYGVINWVTNGLFLGNRHTYLTAQPDDVFIDDDIWYVGRTCGSPSDNTGVSYRIAGSDLLTLASWQKSKQAQPTSANLRIDLPFNGYGTTNGAYTPDTLTPAAQQLQGQFNWVSHTYDHTNLDNVSYGTAYTELKQNNTVAVKTLGLNSNYTRTAMVTPDISGLSNPAFLQAAYDIGIRYLVSDTSIASENNPSPNAGIYNSIQPSILEMPRHPTNLYFNVETPAEWVAEDNCLYPTGAYGHVDTYQQLLDRESNVLLVYMLKGDMDPLMFHQPNLGAYDGVHSLLSDLFDLTLSKYNTYFKLPVLSPQEDVLGKTLAQRMAYNASGVTASIVPLSASPTPTITLTATNAATIPVTGLKAAGYKVELYGGQNISYITLAAGQSVTLPLQ